MTWTAAAAATDLMQVLVVLVVCSEAGSFGEQDAFGGREHGSWRAEHGKSGHTALQLHDTSEDFIRYSSCTSENCPGSWLRRTASSHVPGLSSEANNWKNVCAVSEIDAKSDALYF
jgi:hypothetical protein